MLIFYIILGFLTASIGALPIGTVNLVVLQHTLKKDQKSVIQLILSAGIGEIILAFIALSFSMISSIFFKQYTWIQYVFIILFLMLGIYFLYFKTKGKTGIRTISPIFKVPKLFLGFILAILNPPVILYWMASISIINTYVIILNKNTSVMLISLFLLGIYLGKTSVLYLYTKWGQKIAIQESSPIKAYKTIGIVLVLISILQSIKLAA